MMTSNSQKLIRSKGMKKDRSAAEALKRRQKKRAEIELRQLANQYGIDHREIQ